MSKNAKGKKLKPVVIMIVLVVLTGVFSIGNIAFGKRSTTSLENLSLGENYISELEYKQAIVNYKAQLEIDPQNKQVKESLAESYDKWADMAVDAGDYSLAVEILKAGFSDTHSPDLVWEIAGIALKGMGFEDIFQQAKEGYNLFSD